MVETNLNFEEDIEIDPTALDVELLRHPTLFYRYSRNESNAKKVLAEAHERVKTIRSELIKEASADKTIKNATQIEAFYRNSTRYQEAKKDMIEAEYEANMASAAVWSFQQRKSSLENLVKLAGMDYFARPSEPRNLESEVEKAERRKAATDRRAEKTRSRLSRKRRTKKQ